VSGLRSIALDWRGSKRTCRGCARSAYRMAGGLRFGRRSSLAMRSSQLKLSGTRRDGARGCWVGQLGLFAGQRPHERVLVLLALLGSQQRVELPRASIEIARP
jgi:hypothetical protein